MGWASGSHLIEQIIESAKINFRSEDREDFYSDLLDAFEGQDWDNHDEVVGLDPAFDRVLKERYPEMFDDPDDDEDDED